MYAANQIPDRISCLEEFLERVLRCDQLIAHGGIEINPKRGQHFSRQILHTSHRRGVGDQGIEDLVVGCGDGVALACGAQRHHIARGKIAPPRPGRRQNAADFSGPEMQQTMPGTKGEGLGETLGKRGRQGWCVGIRRHQQAAVRCQQRREEVSGGC